MYCMPISVFFIGILSIILLLWVERISNRLRIDEVLIDAVMDVQLHTATAHLRLEEQTKICGQTPTTISG